MAIFKKILEFLHYKYQNLQNYSLLSKKALKNSLYSIHTSGQYDMQIGDIKIHASHHGQHSFV